MSIRSQNPTAAKARSTALDTPCNSSKRRSSRCPQSRWLRNSLDPIPAVSGRQIESIDSTDENTKAKDLLIKYARDPNHAALFNYASAAHNNHFFFETLTPDPTPIPNPLLSPIDSSFSSLASLRSHFIATADSMFGPGYVWLVKRTQVTMNENMKLAILATYNAGSPYPGAHFRQQPVDMNTAATGVTADMSPTGYARMMRGEEGTNPMDDRLRVYGKGYGTGNPNAPPSQEAPYSGTAGSFGA
ncbi:MAG: hypothetical protein Q9180_003727, partial [Flavoplaca navasiana]